LGTILLLNYSELSAATVVGTDLLLGIVLAVVGSFFHLSWGSINSASLLRLLAGGIPGVLLGCALAKKVPAQKLRLAVAGVAIVLGLQLIWLGGYPLVHAGTATTLRKPSESSAAVRTARAPRATPNSNAEIPLFEPFYSFPIGVTVLEHCCR